MLDKVSRFLAACSVWVGCPHHWRRVYGTKSTKAIFRTEHLRKHRGDHGKGLNRIYFTLSRSHLHNFTCPKSLIAFIIMQFTCLLVLYSMDTIQYPQRLIHLLKVEHSPRRYNEFPLPFSCHNINVFHHQLALLPSKPLMTALLLTPSNILVLIHLGALQVNGPQPFSIH